ncbi:MAG: 1-acyl-sn-glycerol-3-phosphate acyltransferase [Epsilonproteobacteria bacterium]|nr:MAG: 1-acyl-sn-glycerol-3-phosphate acyltransferase [Campylobacterota bacterium]
MKIFAHLSWLYATIIIFFAMTLMIIIFPFIPTPYAQKITSWFIRLALFMPVTVVGKEDPEVEMFLLNHQSDIDIGLMETISKRDLAWVAKKELFDVPFYGLVVRLPKDIAVERESKSSLIKLITDCKDRLDHGRVITMFPEGTRSKTGKMRSFKPGAKMVADKFKLRVQPVVLIETSKHYDIKRFYHRPGRLTAIYLDSFDADRSDKEWLKLLQVEMQEVYDQYASN